MKTNFKQKITNYLNSLSDELRLSIDHNKSKPRTPKLNKLGKLAVVLCCVIYLLIGCFGGIKSSALEPDLPEQNPDGSPTDLTGYTVTVPAGWSAMAGYGSFDISGFIKVFDYLGDAYLSFEGFDVGYVRSGSTSLNCIYTEILNDPMFEGPFALLSSYGEFSFSITGGSSVGNSSLIQWLVDNNATFVNNNTPEEPESTTVTVPAGIYYLQNIYNDLRGTIVFDKPFTTSNGEEFVSIEFAAYNQNNQYTQVFYYTNPVTDAGPSPSVPKPIYNGVNGFTDISDCIIFLEEDTVIEYYDELWDDTFVAVNTDTKLINLYNGAFNIGDAEGYDRGYTVGDADGYQEGYDDGRAHGMEDGFMSNFFGGIVDALDALTLFGNISMLDIIEGILGLMLCLWILKLIAGG